MTSKAHRVIIALILYVIMHNNHTFTIYDNKG